MASRTIADEERRFQRQAASVAERTLRALARGAIMGRRRLNLLGTPDHLVLERGRPGTSRRRPRARVVWTLAPSLANDLEFANLRGRGGRWSRDCGVAAFSAPLPAVAGLRTAHLPPRIQPTALIADPVFNLGWTRSWGGRDGGDWSGKRSRSLKSRPIVAVCFRRPLNTIL